MKRIPINTGLAVITQHGRTLLHENGILFLNWTCSGVSFNFTGKTLLADLYAVPGAELEMGRDMPFAPPKLTERKTWPCLAVFLDDDPQPYRYFEIGREQSSEVIFAASQAETHKITIRKMSENPKGKAGILAFVTDGDLSPAAVAPGRLKLEFIGDSITCGFGNATSERDRLFFSQDENGWLAHPAVAARILDAEFSTICYSGIAIMRWPMSLGDRKMPNMGDLYPYTDRLAEEMYGQTDHFRAWDFAANLPDVIVINLGTNDASVIDFGNLGQEGQRRFEDEYIAFLKLLREKNGKQPWIVCALGTMDYFLYDNLARAVGRYQAETGDERTSTFKYGRMRITEGFGGCGHPNLATHQRMGEEIAACIKKLTGR
jgi:lysophospholipase L1-like esterase